MSPRLAFAIDAAYRAGKFTLGYFQTGTEVLIKNDETPVTVADQGAERMIRESIEAKYPRDSILGEEEGTTGTGEDRWVVDPIDGTKSFICGVPLYATLLSYEIENEPILGVCYLPAIDQMLYAEKGTGAFLNGRPIHVSKRAQLKGSAIACGGPSSMIAKGRMDTFLGLSEHAMITRTWCDAYGHALVASGRIDGMVDPTVNRWDISAMAIIIREAGGMFTDFKGSETLSDEVISSNGHIHSLLLAGYAD